MLDPGEPFLLTGRHEIPIDEQSCIPVMPKNSSDSDCDVLFHDFSAFAFGLFKLPSLGLFCLRSTGATLPKTPSRALGLDSS